MDGIAFESLVAAKMRGFGWECTSTPGSSDYGADVICTLGNHKLIIQCKCYADASYVGGDAVRAAYAAVAHYGASHGLVIYRGRPTSQARKLASSTGVHLFHFDELQRGWKFDRTSEGLEARRRQERELEKARRERELVEERDYRVAVKDFQQRLQKWNAQEERHEKFKVVSGIALFVSIVSFADGDTATGVIALLVAGFAYWGTSPGAKPSRPSMPLHMEKTGVATGTAAPASTGHSSTVVKSTPTPVEAARSLRLIGYPIDQRNGSWFLTDKRGTVRALSNDELLEFSAGKARVACIGCGVQLRGPAQLEVELRCPKCGATETYQT